MLLLELLLLQLLLKSIGHGLIRVHTRPLIMMHHGGTSRSRSATSNHHTSLLRGSSKHALLGSLTFGPRE
jgi:hypothetical protein